MKSKNSHKIKKTSWLRRRFVISNTPLDPLSWSDLSSELKQKILIDSAYQLVGDKTILKVSDKNSDTQVMIEVLGIPKLGLDFIDLEAAECLEYEFPECAFDVDFLTVKERAAELMRAVSYNLEDEYHIVLSGRNLALHFFIQKDYIQS